MGQFLYEALFAWLSGKSNWSLARRVFALVVSITVLLLVLEALYSVVGDLG